MWDEGMDYISLDADGWRQRSQIETPGFFYQYVTRPAEEISTRSYGSFQRTFSQLKSRRGDWFRRDQGNSPFYSEVTEILPSTQRQLHTYRVSSYTGYDIIQDVFPSLEYDNLTRQLNGMPDASTLTPMWATSAVPWLELKGMGASCIASALPTVPEASLATTIGELLILQDIRGLPDVPGSKTLDLWSIGKRRDSNANLKSLADDWLNWQFAILPTIADFKDLIDAARSSNQRVAQLYRDNGRGIRRRFALPEEVETSESTVSGVYPAAQKTYNWASHFSTGQLRTERVIKRNVWFSGKFSYTLTQAGIKWMDDFLDIDRAIGLIPRGDTVWQLIAWSWLIDWVSNAQDVVLNASYLGRDGLKLDYGYVMCETTLTETQTWTGSFTARSGLAKSPFEISQSRRTVTKQRLRASPWGFNVDWPDFTPRQLSILAALGVSRVHP